ncbi:MAG: glycosyltransferase family 4 protein [Candidatus Brocadiia bacterium]
MSAARRDAAPLRILYVSDTGQQLGGAERSLLSLVEQFDLRRYTLHAALGDEGRFATLLRGAHVDVRVLPLGAVARTRNPLRLLGYAAVFLHGVVRLAWLVRRLGIHVVHANKTTAAILAVPAARLGGARSVWHVRNRARRFGRAGRWLVRRADRLVCVSESIAQPFRQAVPEARDAMSVIHEGIDPAPYAARQAGQAVRRELGLEPEHRVVGTVGRLTPWKGQDDFLRAAALVAADHPEARFLVVGDCVSSPAERAADEAYRERLHALAGELGIADRVRFTGYREDVPAVMNALDLFVLPSHEEPFGIVVLEAMAAGRPIVATEAGGVPEIVRHEREALLAPPGEPQALAAAIARLLADPPLAQGLGRAAQTRVAEEFPLWRPAARIRAIYEELAGGERT